VKALKTHFDPSGCCPRLRPFLEVFSAESRKDLLEEVLGMKVEIIVHGAAAETHVNTPLPEAQSGAVSGQ
jgi:hypothetical protein